MKAEGKDFYKTTKTVKTDPIESRIRHVHAHVNSADKFFDFINNIYEANNKALVGGRSIASLLSPLIHFSYRASLTQLINKIIFQKNAKTYELTIDRDNNSVTVLAYPLNSNHFYVEKALSLLFDVSDIEPDHKNNMYSYTITFKPSTRKASGDDCNDLKIIGKNDKKTDKEIKKRSDEIDNLSISAKEKSDQISALKAQVRSLELSLCTDNITINRLKKENILATAGNKDNIINSFGRVANNIAINSGGH